MPEPRGPLPPEVEIAARTISRAVWHQPYVAKEGPMHYAGGPWHANNLRRLADHWERLAAAARVCADYLGDGEFPEEDEAHG